MEPLIWKSIIYFIVLCGWFETITYDLFLRFPGLNLSSKKRVLISLSVSGVVYQTIFSVMSFCHLFEYLSEEEWMNYQFVTIGYYSYMGVMSLRFSKDILFSISYFVFGMMVYFLFEEYSLTFSALYLLNSSLIPRYICNIYISLDRNFVIHPKCIAIIHNISLLFLFSRLYIFSDMIILSFFEESAFMFFGSLFFIYGDVKTFMTRY